MHLVWLLRAEDEEELEAEYNDLLAQLLALPASLETKVRTTAESLMFHLT